MRKIKTVLKFGLSIFKTIYLNFKVLPFAQAIKFPILVSYRTKIIGVTPGCIRINSQVKPFMIKFGFQDGTLGVPQTVLENYLIFGKNGRAEFEGKATFACGISLRVDSGFVKFGDNFSCNKCCFIACNSEMFFGRNVLIGWNTNIRDMDGHSVWKGARTDECLQMGEKPVHIGDNVWIAACVDILKGTTIPDGCIVAYRSCVNKKFETERSIIGGYPAKVLKENIYWQ